MLNKTTCFYFSPTGGTFKAASTLANNLASEVNFVNLPKCDLATLTLPDISIVALPVFAGRIPLSCREKLKMLNGKGKKAVTIVVYGVRAYDDALLELNDVMEQAGFEIVASGAFVSQHSIAKQVGVGRPNDKDKQELTAFANKIIEKLKSSVANKITVPGNRPYREVVPSQITPICNENCVLCKKCLDVCPYNAISLKDNAIVTEANKCDRCLSCVTVCQQNARDLPTQFSETLSQKLDVFKDVDRQNEIFI